MGTSRCSGSLDMVHSCLLCYWRLNVLYSLDGDVLHLLNR